MMTKGILARSIRIPWRGLLAMLLLLATMLAVTAWASARQPPPSFRLDKGQGSIAPVGYAWWRALGDRIMGRKYVVLSFDDGPYGAGVDERILDTLRRHHAPAMFFLVCSHLTPATVHVPDEIRRDGYLIGNHSYDHRHLIKLGAKALRHQIDDCSTRLAAVSGDAPRFFRPPFGETSARVLHDVRAAGMRQVMWNANSEDSWLTRPDQILYWSIRQTDNFSILLMHDKPATAAVLDRVLIRLENRGFRFVLPDAGRVTASAATHH